MPVAHPAIAFAYLRFDGRPDEEAELVAETAVLTFAEEHGWRLTAMFFEFDTGSFVVLEELVAAACLMGVAHVVLPSAGHVAAHRLLRERVVERLVAKSGTQVWTVTEGRLA